MLLAFATVSAGLVVLEPMVPWGSGVPAKAQAAEAVAAAPPIANNGPALYLVAEDDQALPALDGVAQGIRALRQQGSMTREAAPATPAAPLPLFQVSQLETAQAGAVPPAAAPRTGTEVDETALRYFAAQGDTARLAAEIARLRQLYPNWTPPADPLAVPQNNDRQLEEMWQLYAEGRYPEVRKAIVARQAADPAWEPPADLLDRLQIAEARSRLVNASNLKQYQTVIDVGAANPPLLNCSEVDVLWRVAEAFSRTERPQRAVDAYSYILTNCANQAERLATLQKAADTLPYDRVQPLLALEKPNEAGAREFDAIRDDLARRFVAAANEEPSLQIAQEYIDRLQASARADGPASDSVLLGWYFLRRDNADEAVTWFRRAREREDSPNATQGLALALLEQDKPAEAEGVLYPSRKASKDAMATYLAATANLLALDPPPTIEETILTRMAETVIAERYVPSAQQFGWYARAFDQPQTAAQWFEMALEWAPQDEPSAYGLALTRLQLNDRAGFAQLQQKWAKTSARIADLERPPVGAGRTQSANAPRATQRTQSAQRAQSVQSAPSVEPLRLSQPAASREVSAAQRAPSLPATAPLPAAANSGRSSSSCASAGRSSAGSARLSAGAALQQGWCLMELNRPLEAADSFGVALSSQDRSISEDAAYGQSLAYLRLGLTDRAAVAATRAPMRAARARELQASILADRALHAFQSDRYRETLLYLDQRAQVQQEPVDLMVLRAYSYVNLNRTSEAMRLFEAAAATGNRDASRGLADLRDALDFK
nr:cellulose synthase [Rhizobium sp. SSA_523]